MRVRFAGAGMLHEFVAKDGSKVRELVELASQRMSQPVDLSKSVVRVNGVRIDDPDREIHEQQANILLIQNFVGG